MVLGRYNFYWFSLGIEVPRVSRQSSKEDLIRDIRRRPLNEVKESYEFIRI